MELFPGWEPDHFGRIAFLVAVLVLESAGAQKSTVNKESSERFNRVAIAAGKSADVHQLDSKLAAEKFESWFQRQAGDTTIAWESNHCGEASPPTGDSDHDMPICAKAALTFADGATATVVIGVGSEKKGIHPPYQVWMEVAEGRPGRTLELHDLPDILAPHRKATTESESPPSPAPRTTACGQLLPGAEGLIRKQAFILIGEVRGTQEAPSFVGQLACYLAKNSEVLLALDIAASEQEPINRFLSSAASKDDVYSLLTGDFWGRGLQDGRASRAVLALLNQARILRQAGRAISIACIDAPVDERTKDKNRIWAANILRAKLAHPNAAVVTLLNRTPARVQTGLPGNPDYVPAGWYLKQKVPDLVSLSMSFARGSAWSCQQDGCAVHPLEGDEHGDRAYVHLGSPVANEESASGTLFFPAIAPSEPAKTLLQAKGGSSISH